MLRKVLVLPDLHAPYHDHKAFELFLKVGGAILTENDYLVSIGDTLDFFSVSSHPKPPNRQHNLKEELEDGKVCLRQIEELPGRKVFLGGNHESRLERYIRDVAPKLFGIIDIPELLELDKWVYVPYGEYYKVGKMAFTHDVGRAGVNAARQTLNDWGGNITFGHTHQGAVIYGGTVRGETHVCLNVGWMGDLKYIDYFNKAKANRQWQHGFGLIYIQDNGNCHAFFHPIVNYRCVVEGKLYGI